MKYEIDGDKYTNLEEVILHIRSIVRKAKRENKKEFTFETNEFE